MALVGLLQNIFFSSPGHFFIRFSPALAALVGPEQNSFFLTGHFFTRFVPRETIEGWPLPTIKTEANGDSMSTIKEILSWLVCWARRAGIRDFSLALAALVGPVQNIFFLTGRLLLDLSPERLKRGMAPVDCHN